MHVNTIISAPVVKFVNSEHSVIAVYLVVIMVQVTNYKLWLIIYLDLYVASYMFLGCYLQIAASYIKMLSHA